MNNWFATLSWVIILSIHATLIPNHIETANDDGALEQSNQDPHKDHDALSLVVTIALVYSPIIHNWLTISTNSLQNKFNSFLFSHQ